MTNQRRRGLREIRCSNGTSTEHEFGVAFRMAGLIAGDPLPDVYNAGQLGGSWGTVLVSGQGCGVCLPVVRLSKYGAILALDFKS